MKGYGKSRQELFVTLDKPALKPLPQNPYVFSSWKKVRVNIDYHIAFERCFYSVPHSFQVPNGSSATVQEAIRQALLGRRWAIQEKLPDGYIAQYNRRPDVWARIKVTHLGRQVTIRYVDSEGLKYKKNRFGSVSVSRWYRTWVLNLESDIKFQIGKTVVS